VKAGSDQVLRKHAAIIAIKAFKFGAPGPRSPFPAPTRCAILRENPKEVNGAVHFSTLAQFLSIGRTCNSEHFGARLFADVKITYPVLPGAPVQLHKFPAIA